MPATHLIWGEARNDVPVRIQEVVPLAAPVNAIQTMGTGPVVFVRTSEGFQRRQVVLGQSDDRATEVVSGLRVGETIAVSNTFLLKAEMLKGAGEEQ